MTAVLLFALAQDEWTAVQVPTDRGPGWYRCFVKVPDAFAAARDLWSESVTLALPAGEAYVNGTRLEGSDRLKVPPGLLQKGAYNTIAVRARGLSAAPVLSGYHVECVLKGEWEMRAEYAPEGPRKDRPPRAVFERFVEATSPLKLPAKLLTGPSLPPDESKKKMKVAPDLQLDLVLAEPDIAQPLFMTFDERGRLWVVEYRQYPFPAGISMVSRDKYYRAVYDKVPPAPPNHVRGRDRITIHEDTDGDGTFDKHTTFVDGLNITTAVAIGRGGAWVLNPPYLLFYPDKPGSDPVVHLEGFGLEDTHSVANSLSWGPDGWLYGAQGSTVASQIRRPGSSEVVYREGPMIWRYHPESHRYEIYAEGGGNAFGLEFDAAGRLYSGYNGGNTRGFHYVPGGYYIKAVEAGKYGPLSNPYAYGNLPAMTHAPVARFTHTFAKYEADALPELYRGKMFCVDPLHRNVVLSDIEPEGCNFKTRDIATPLSSDDPAFRPVDVTVGPDGAVYIADFYEYYIAHGQHYQGQLDPTTGRIYRLRSGAAGMRPFDLSKESSDKLIEYLSHPNKWFRQTALRILGDRKDRSVLPRLEAIPSVETLWAYHLIAGSVPAKALDHTDPLVRMWAVRLIDDPTKFAARRETNVEVRCQLAARARKFPALIPELLSRDEDARDPFLPLMLWWAVEANPNIELDVSLWDRPIVRDHILGRLMRRLAHSGKRNELAACARLLKMAPTAEHRKTLIQGFEQAFQGRPVTGLPEELETALREAGGGSLAFRVRRGEKIDEALALVADAKANRSSRLECISALGEVRTPRAVPALLAAAKDRDAEIRTAALGALSIYEDASIGPEAVKLLPDASAWSLLASRPAWSIVALQTEHAAPDEYLERMKLHDDPRVNELIKKRSFGPRSKPRKFADIVRSGAGNPYAGKELFANLCSRCHTLFSSGGKIGPDLTPYNRNDLDTMLLSIVEPSAEIREGFETYVIRTKDGRVLDGFLADQDPRVVVLRASDGQTITVPRAEIDVMKRSPRSLMPEGLLDPLSEQQVRDLVAYLRNSQPIGK